MRRQPLILGFTKDESLHIWGLIGSLGRVNNLCSLGSLRGCHNATTSNQRVVPIAAVAAGCPCLADPTV